MLTFEKDFGVAREFLEKVVAADPTASASYLHFNNDAADWLSDEAADEDVDLFDHFQMEQKPLVCLRLRFRERLDEEDDGFLDLVYNGGGN